MKPSPAHVVEFGAREMLERHAELDFGAGARSRLDVVALPDGSQLLGWQAQFERTLELRLHDDSDAVHLSYTLQGRSRCWISRDGRTREHALDEAAGHLHHGPGRRARFLQCGGYRSVSVVLPAALAAPVVAASAGGFITGLRGRELHACALGLAAALAPGAPPRHTLWLQGQALAFVGLLLEAGAGGCEPAPDAAERQRLLAARDRLLADLSAPPLLAEVAAAHGLTPARLQRGFKALFGRSAYALFQHERMQEARRRLLADAASVTEVATELGYTNTSHFAAAFRREFGAPPGQLAGRRRG
ncbi:AraC family transcriptional regulator [Rubrivivax gelatinosus]|nr:AraC family transcriptional regulator [Rubrivivax gelatinosus]